MGLKVLEMQIALPRTQDAGQLQEQLQNRFQNAQSMLNEQQLKELDRHRKAVLEANQKEDVQISDDEEPSHEGAQDQEERKSHADTEEIGEKIVHPYLGQHVDFSG